MTARTNDVKRPPVGTGFDTPSWTSMQEKGDHLKWSRKDPGPFVYGPSPEHRFHEIAYSIRRILAYRGEGWRDVGRGVGKYVYKFTVSCLAVMMSRYAKTRQPEPGTEYEVDDTPRKVRAFDGSQRIRLKDCNVNDYDLFNPQNPIFSVIGNPVSAGGPKSKLTEIDWIEEDGGGKIVNNADLSDYSFDHEREKHAASMLSLALGATAYAVSQPVETVLDVTSFAIDAVGLAEDIFGSPERTGRVRSSSDKKYLFERGIELDNIYTGVFHSMDFDVYAKPGHSYTIEVTSAYEPTDLVAPNAGDETNIEAAMRSNREASWQVEIPANPQPDTRPVEADEEPRIA